jgi:hypothetical protein
MELGIHRNDTLVWRRSSSDRDIYRSFIQSTRTISLLPGSCGVREDKISAKNRNLLDLTLSPDQPDSLKVLIMMTRASPLSRLGTMDSGLSLDHLDCRARETFINIH